MLVVFAHYEAVGGCCASWLDTLSSRDETWNLTHSCDHSLSADSVLQGFNGTIFAVSDSYIARFCVQARCRTSDSPGDMIRS